MSDICGDNRFGVIKKAKEYLLKVTNIETSADEMSCIDSFLFRCWQVGWLDKFDETKEEPRKHGHWKFCSDELPNTNDQVLVKCTNFPTYRIGSYENGFWETGGIGVWCKSSLESGVVISWREIPNYCGAQMDGKDE